MLLEIGEARAAIREFSSARQTFRRSGDTLGEFQAMLGLARSYVEIGEEEKQQAQAVLAGVTTNGLAGDAGDAGGAS